MKWKKIVFDATMIVLLSLCFYPIRNYLSIPSFGSVTDGNDNRFEPGLYYSVHASAAAPDTSISISLVDISDLSGPESHNQISSVINRIRLYHPRMLGVDAVFKKNSGMVNDSSLVSTASMALDSTVFVMDLVDYDSKSFGYKDSHRSFFADSLKCKEGYSNLCNQGDQSLVTQFTPHNYLNGNEVLSLPMMMAGPMVDSSLITSKSYFIDYSPIYFPRMSHKSIDSSLIVDRFVLLGGLWDNNDMFNTPLGMKSGMEIHAYTLRTLLETNLMDDSNTMGEKVIASFVCIVFCFLLVIIDVKLSYSKINVIRYIGQESLISIGVAVFFTYLLGLIGYILFMQGIFLSMRPAVDVMLRVVTVAKIIYVSFITLVTQYTTCKMRMSMYGEIENNN